MQILNIDHQIKYGRAPDTDRRYLNIRVHPEFGTSFAMSGANEHADYDLVTSFLSERTGLVCMMSSAFAFDHPKGVRRSNKMLDDWESSTLDLPTQEAYQVLLSLIDFDRGDRVMLTEPTTWKDLTRDDAAALVLT
jgi:hypothetical protein